MKKLANISLFLLFSYLFIFCERNEDLELLKATEILSTCPLGIEEPYPQDSIREVFKVVEQMPRFFDETCENMEGSNADKYACANEKMLEYWDNHIVYPKKASKNNIEGTVTVQFEVKDSTGCLSNIRIIRDIGYGCGIELQRVVSTMPDFVVGRQRGIPVTVQLTVSYEFKL